MKVMLDSNILISIAIFNSEKLKKLLEHVCQNYELIITSTIINEIETVILRKFPNKLEAMEKFMYKLPYQYEYIPESILNETTIELRDPKDIPILYSAILSNVDVFVSGDNDFDNVKIEKPEILKASEFLNKY